MEDTNHFVRGPREGGRPLDGARSCSAQTSRYNKTKKNRRELQQRARILPVFRGMIPKIHRTHPDPTPNRATWLLADDIISLSKKKYHSNEILTFRSRPFCKYISIYCIHTNARRREIRCFFFVVHFFFVFHSPTGFTVVPTIASATPTNTATFILPNMIARPRGCCF